MNDKEIDKELEKHFGKPPLPTEEIAERLKSCSQEEALQMVYGDFAAKLKKDAEERAKLEKLEIEDPDEHEYQLAKLDAMQLTTKYKIDLAICLFKEAGKEIKEKENQK
tara:strand:- start:713 stop:1039 length:327 start_codon:yes stop_codon:yes gene_type:complete